MEKLVIDNTKDVARFWGHREIPLPSVVRADRNVIRTIGGKLASAAFVPEKGTLIVPENTSKEELVAELAHFLRYLHVGDRFMLEHKPVEEFIEHLTTRGLGVREPLTPGKTKVLRKASTDLLRELVRVHKFLGDVSNKLRERKSEKAAKFVETERRKLEKYLEAFVRGKTVELTSFFNTISTAENIAKMFMDDPKLVSVNYKLLFELNNEGLQQIFDHWPYLLAEFHVERVKKLKPDERKRLLEEAHHRFPELALEYLEQEDREVASYLRKLFKNSSRTTMEKLLTKARFYKNVLLAKLRGKTVKV